MADYTRIRKENIDLIDSMLKEFIDEKQIKNANYFIQAESNRVLIGYSKMVEDPIKESTLEYTYTRKFSMPFDNLDICKQVLIGDIFTVLINLKYDKFDEI